MDRIHIIVNHISCNKYLFLVPTHKISMAIYLFKQAKLRRLVSRDKFLMRRSYSTASHILNGEFYDIFDKYSVHKPKCSHIFSFRIQPDDEYRVTSDESPLAKRTRHNQLSSRIISTCSSSNFRYVSVALTSRQRLLPHSTPLPHHLQRIPEPRSKLLPFHHGASFLSVALLTSKNLTNHPSPELPLQLRP